MSYGGNRADSPRTQSEPGSPGAPTPPRAFEAAWAAHANHGAGWTDPERQRPVGDTARHEPAHADAVIDAELERALTDPDPLRGIAQLTARLAAAFVLDPAGVTRTKALGSERIERKLRDALPSGDGELRAAVWEFMRPMLSPALVALNHDTFVVNESAETTVDLDGHRAASDLDELALDDEPDSEAA